MTRATDLTGHRVGKLTAIQRAENTPAGKAQWLCRCDCGREVVRQAATLRRERSRSCGCLKGGPARDMSPAAQARRQKNRENYSRRKREREMVMSLATMKW